MARLQGYATFIGGRYIKVLQIFRKSSSEYENVDTICHEYLKF